MNIIMCFDGTSNKFEKVNTNVVKLYRVANRENQLKCYIPGVGSNSDRKDIFFVSRYIKKYMGLAFGYGLQERVIAGYNFLVDNYSEGDKIFLFGFSRGAYTAKVLSGLIHACGLMGRGNEYLVKYAYSLYSSNNPNFEVMSKFKHTFSVCEPEISFMGLWDSVSSVGHIWRMRNFPFTSNMNNVNVLRHALAIDEKRTMFMNNTSIIKGDSVNMWFAGVHSDVGGGFPEEESSLSKIPLEWMITEARKEGLSIDEDDYNKYVLGLPPSDYVKPDNLGPMHRNRWFWLIFNLVPRLKYSYKPKKVSMYLPIFNKRKILNTDKVHKSVTERIANTNYKLPERHELSI